MTRSLIREPTPMAGVSVASSRMNESSRMLERRDFFPNLGEPAFALIVGNRAGGNVFDGGLGDVVAVDRVVRHDVFAADNASQHSILGFAGERNFAGAFDDQIVIR